MAGTAFDRLLTALGPHLVTTAGDAWARPARGDEPGLGDGRETLLKDAAVLFGLIDRGGDPQLLLTTRTDGLRAHAGQVALPGGKIDATDASPMATALREAQEEIGLTLDHVRPLGYLDPYLTRSGYRIMPVAAVISPRFRPALNAGEVVDAFEVPVAFLMNHDNHRIGAREWGGRLRHYFEMPYTDAGGNERYIWGVTAGMIRTVSERIRDIWPG